jgi:hypothetical protein
MSTKTLAELETLLTELGLLIPVPIFPSAKILQNPVDIARSYLADIVHQLVQGEPGIAYSAIQLPQAIDGFAGDLTIILPRLSKDSGIDSTALTQHLFESVSVCRSWPAIHN